MLIILGRHAHILLATLLSCSTSVCSIAAAETSSSKRLDTVGKVDVIRMDTAAWSPPIREYQKEVIKLILQSSGDEYGEFSLVESSGAGSAIMVMDAIRQAKNVHIGFLSKGLGRDGFEKTTKNNNADVKWYFRS
ncbi:MAG: hypothetical protein ACI93R_000413 [Flavobacteriales bacterium]